MFKKLGKYLLSLKFTKEEVISAFRESDNSYAPLEFVNNDLSKAIDKFCIKEGLEYTSFLPTIEVNQLF